MGVNYQFVMIEDEGWSLFCGNRDAMSTSTHSTSNEGAKDLLRIILAVLLPPVGVFLQVGLGLHFWINIVLTLLGYVPGIIHALYVILSRRG